jgi:hypothetical protein
MDLNFAIYSAFLFFFIKHFNFKHFQFRSIFILDMLSSLLAILETLYPMPSIFYLSLLKLETLTFDLHQRSRNRKNTSVHEDHFPAEFLKISQLEPKILAFLVRWGGN